MYILPPLVRYLAWLICLDWARSEKTVHLGRWYFFRALPDITIFHPLDTCFTPWQTSNWPPGHKNLPLDMVNSHNGYSSFSGFFRHPWTIYLPTPMNSFFLEARISATTTLMYWYIIIDNQIESESKTWKWKSKYLAENFSSFRSWKFARWSKTQSFALLR